MSRSAGGWTIGIPLKALDAAKSRLRAEVADAGGLALAFAVDTLAAVRAAGEVARIVVVASDPRIADAVGRLGVELRPDPGEGLNPAALAAIQGAPGPVAVVTGDLPALRSADLDDALRAAAAHPLAMVPDAEGTGTTLLTALDARALLPRFGLGSRARHEAAGHAVLDLPPDSTLRRDIDTPADLAAALLLGLGPATRVALARRPVPSVEKRRAECESPLVE